MHVINNNINEKERGTKEALHYEKSSQFQEMRQTDQERNREKGRERRRRRRRKRKILEK